MSRGRKPTRLVNGMQYDVELPPPPKFLSDTAKGFYNDVGKLLVERGVMGAPFGIALAMLAVAMEEYVTSAAESASAPTAVLNTRKVTTLHPAHKRLQKAEERMIKILREFGMTPATLTTVKGMTIPGDIGSNVQTRNRGGSIPKLRIAD